MTPWRRADLTCVDARCPQRQLPHAGHAQDGAVGQESIHRLSAEVPLHRAPAATAAARVRAAGAGELWLVTWQQYSSLIGPEDEYCDPVNCDWLVTAKLSSDSFRCRCQRKSMPVLTSCSLRWALLISAVKCYLVRYSDAGGEEQREQASQPRAVRRHRGLQVGLRAWQKCGSGDMQTTEVERPYFDFQVHYWLSTFFAPSSTFLGKNKYI